MNKIEEMNQVQKAMSNVKKIVSNFTSYFEKIMCYNREISESIFLLFNNNKEYKEFANILTSVHVDNNKLFQSIIDEISFLTKETQDWDNYYSSVKILVQDREESRKVYDHYEKKLEKLEDKKDQKIREGSYVEGSDFYTIITRNETKYINAKDDYVKKAICAYDTIDKLNNNRFNIVTPVLLNMFFIEMTLYESFSAKYKEYKDIEYILHKMRKEFMKKPKNVYNPLNFTKSPHLEEKFENLKKNRDFKSSSPEFARKKSFVNEEQIDLNGIHINKFRRKVSKEIVEEEKEKENNNDMINLDKNRSANHYNRKSSKQNNTYVGEFTVNEFNKIGNKFSNDSSIRLNDFIRNDTIQSQSNKNDKNPINYKNFPTFNSVIEDQFNISNLSKKESSYGFDCDINLRTSQQISSTNKKPQTLMANSNILNEINCESKPIYQNHVQQNISPTNDINNFNQFDLIWDFTQKPKSNEIFENNTNHQKTINQKDLQKIGSNKINYNNDLNRNADINLNDLLNTSKNSKPVCNVNNTIKKDPFEGFY